MATIPRTGDLVPALARPERDLLRIVVVGSVDDGKSTLIGRLLWEGEALAEDQVASVRRASGRLPRLAGAEAGAGEEPEIDFSLFTDGLRAEREQGITIDVAYRAFSTRRRRFIVADTPGHEQYTRNMATGASTADAAVILVDARLGVSPQTRRHAAIAALLGIRHVAVAVNKMDAVGDDRGRFDEVASAFGAVARSLGIEDVRFFPISARRGDNVTRPSASMTWHDGGTLLAWLESLPPREGVEEAPFRFPVQLVLRRPDGGRGLAGQVVSGTVRAGDDVVVLPSRRRTRVASIDVFEGSLPEASAPRSIALRLADDVDVGRGDVITSAERTPVVADEVEASLAWIGDAPLDPGTRYLVKHGTRVVPAQVVEVIARMDLERLEEVAAPTLELNDVGRVRLALHQPIAVDRYRDDRRTGAFIVIDPATRDTVAAGMVRAAREAARADEPVAAPERAAAPRALAGPAQEEPVRADGPQAVGGPEGRTHLLRLLSGLGAGELTWISGYAAGLAAARGVEAPIAFAGPPAVAALGGAAALAVAAPAPAPVPAPEAKPAPTLTIVHGSQTGNGRRLAERLAREAGRAGLAVRTFAAGEYPVRELASERLLYVVISTHGDGDPPDDARAFLEHLDGPRAPRLAALGYAVLALGDSSYPKFCETGRRLDARLEALGARRVAERGECDADVEPVAAPWIAAATETASRLLAPPATVSAPAAAGAPTAAPRLVVHDRDAPFAARVLANERITGRGALKDVRHVELSLEGSGLAYEPGDALGVWPVNPPALVEEVLALARLDGGETVEREGATAELAGWLRDELEITRLSRPFLAAHAQLVPGGEAARLLEPARAEELRAFLATAQVVDVLRLHPAPWTAGTLVAALRRLTPRLYSIASSRKRVGEEAHLTVRVVGYDAFGAAHVGAASSHLATRDASDAARSTVAAYVEPNPRFRLPADPARDVIMIGPGTGVAPFRGFVQERAEVGARGRNWLFFGEQRFRDQFLYQVEWQEALRQGHLHRLDVAFSRDRRDGAYVQDRLREQRRELLAWLEGGAHVYVCGDATRMAPAVHAALADVLTDGGTRSREWAESRLDALRAEGRYLRDVY